MVEMSDDFFICQSPMKVEACRARLFRMASLPMDEETPSVTADWRESCKRAIIPEVQ